MEVSESAVERREPSLLATRQLSQPGIGHLPVTLQVPVGS
jgi:hypothetical protein